MKNAEMEEAQAGIKISRRNINNLRYADVTTCTAESKEELKSLLMKVKREKENVDLKNGNSDRLYFLGAPKSLKMVTAAMKLKDTYS